MLLLRHRFSVWCSTPFSTIFQLYRGSQFFKWRKSEDLEKTTDVPEVTVKLDHIVLYLVHLVCTGFELTKLVVIGTDCIGSYKSNYYMTTTAPGILLLTAFTKAYFVHKNQMFKFQIT